MQPEDKDGHATGKRDRARLWFQPATPITRRGRKVETALSQRRELLGEDSSALKFASTKTRWWFQAIAVSALLAGLFTSGFMSGSSIPAYAQAVKTAAAAPRVPLLNLPGQGGMQFLPEGVTRRSVSSTGSPTGFSNLKAVKGQGRAQLGGANGFDVAEKTVNITRLSGSDEVHPFWSADGTAVYFEGNASFVGDSASDGYQLYRGPANSSSSTIPTSLTPTRLTNEPGANYRFPVLNNGENRIAFARQRPGSTGYQLYLAANPSNPVPGNPGSFIPSVPDGVNLISLTNSSGSEALPNTQAVIGGRTFVDVGRATFVGTSSIVFAARLSGVGGGPVSPFHLFAVNLNSLAVVQVTDGTTDEENPAISPDGRFIAFDSNAASGSYNPVGGVAVSNSVAAHRNVFTVDSTVATARFTAASQLRIFSYDGGNIYDNLEPAWSRLDPNTIANANGVRYYLSYASSRKTDGTAAVTTDIYYIIANNTVTTTNVLLQETAANKALRLDTADDNFLFNDEYPTFPPFRNNLLQIAFQSDREGNQVKPNVPNSGFNKTNGIHDLFVATLFDINAPTLLRWDTSSTTGDIVHINLGNTYNASPSSAVRNREQGLIPGSTVFFTVRAEDLQSGINSVYLQFKNPNSKYQSAAQGGGGVEHKEYEPGTGGGIFDGAFPFTESVPGGAVPLYWQPRSGIGATTPNPQNVGREFEAEAITAGDGNYTYVNHRRNRNGKTGILPIAGLDDIAAFSGKAVLNNAALTANGVWLKLAPLGVAPQQGGPGGQLYGASWKVPAEASDWYMDVILFDNAVNPIAPTQTNNWIIYDNVWGFSTALSLSPQTVDLLVVMDYALGQKFFASRFGSNGDALVRSSNNLPNIQYGVESYYTDPEVTRYPDGLAAPDPPTSTSAPTTFRVWDANGSFAGHPGSVGSFGGIGTPNTLGVNSYIDALLQDDSTLIDTRTSGGGARLPSVGRYSLWRVLSRGPVPSSLLTDYLPSRTTSPPDQFLGTNGNPLETTPRNVLQANRMVIWASPFTANVFVGAGTIQDLTTQDNLRNFVNQGGRLFISGQDIGFALAGNGQTSSFFTSTLNAQFVSDSANGATSIAPGAASLINNDAFGGTAQHVYSQHNTNAPNSYSPPNSGAINIVHENLPGNGVGWIGDASFAADAQAGNPVFSGSLDVVAPINGAVAEYTYGGGAAMVSSSNANGGRVVYSAVGFEGLSNEFYIYGTNPIISPQGRRAEIMHNITCDFRTGIISGRLLDQNGNPVTDALVRAIRTNSAESSPAAGTGFTDSNGNYQIIGLQPGSYFVFGYRASYYTQKSATTTVHGASRATINLVLRKAGPGGLGGGSGSGGTQNSGGVFRADGVTPIPNIRIYAVRTDAGANGPTTTVYSAKTSDGTLTVDGVLLPPGQYSFGTQLPIGDYLIVANPNQLTNPNNGQPIRDAANQPIVNPDFNSSFATVYLHNPPQPEVTLGAGTTVANNLLHIAEGQTAAVTFRLGSSPQKVTGRVLDQDGKPLAGVIIGGVLSGSTSTAVAVQSAAPTDANGVYTLVTTGTTPSSDIPEGTYVLTASLIGYSTGTVTINVGGAGTLTVPDITLTKLQPGSVSGTVTGGAKLTTPIIGAVVTLYPYVNGAPIDTGSQTATTTAIQTGANGYTFNYQFTSVPPGQYVAIARFIPAGATGALPLVGNPNPSAVFTVTESTETKNINFVLTPLKTYPAGLQMISLPNDYSAFTPYQVFGLAPTNDNDEDGTAGTANDLALYNVFTVADWKVDQSGYSFFGQRFTSDANYDPNLHFQIGKGYFVRFGAAAPVVLAGQGALSNTFDKQLAQAGWYIIGDPFGSVSLPGVQNAPLDLNTDITFSYTTTSGLSRNLVNLAQAAADGVVQKVVFDFSGSNAGSQYRQTTTLLPFQGYWFRSYVPNMTIRFTYPGIGGDLTRSAVQSANGQVLAATVAELMKTNKLTATTQTSSASGIHRTILSTSPSDWRLQIAARQGDLMDIDNSIGVSPNAKDGFDTTSDTTKPPMVGGDQSLYLTIDGTDDKGRSVSTFSDNIRASGTTTKSWDFTVQTTSDQDVTLYWPNVNRLPRTLDPVLVDVQTGRRTSLRTGGASYRYQPKGRSVQKFRIEVLAAASRPLALTNVKTSRVLTGTGEGGKSVQGTYRFSFTATQEADVTADIQSLNGRSLRRMQTRAESGKDTAFVWDGKDANGASLPAGTYIISLTAKDASTGALVRTRVPILSVK